MREWLIQARNNMKMSQAAVAIVVGVTRQMISAIERGTASPSPELAKAIGRVLNIDWTLFY